MKVASSLHELHRDHGLDQVALACGVFDGVHRGHVRILEHLLSLSNETEATPVVLTFDPHPRAILRPDNPPPFLCTITQKLDRFEHIGIKATIILDFSPALAALSAGQFLHDYLLNSPVDVTGICVGASWRFGTRGEGTTRFLENEGRKHNFRVVSVPELTWYGKIVSSTRIRRAIIHGELEKAARMLGRRYAVRGQVVQGKGVGGRQLHCRTANLVASELLLPPHGVYAARGRQCAGSPRRRNPAFLDGIAYIGTAPTFAEQGREKRLEFHFFNRSSDLYGNEIEIEFLEFIRPDRRFPSVADLSRQMESDIATAKEVCVNAP
ncbi:MAG: riboflavin biosynthesis protein RibF [Candidatus Pacebacteria bacterium]|nr:riboflavin biosynthesis protein RibF [Candidatus Paceibacterota bacterium]